jgi:hypothetical protein
MTEQYDPAKVSVVIGGATMRAFADGEMVNVDYAVDENTTHVGTDGYGRHIKTANLSGQMVVRLADYSASNEALTLLHKSDVPFPVIVTDKTSKGDLFQSDSCKFARRPRLVKGNEATMNEWTVNFLRGEIVHTGAKDAE